MIKLKVGLNYIGFFIIVILIICGLFSIDLSGLSAKTACLAVTATMPEGLIGYDYDDSGILIPYYKNENNSTSTNFNNSITMNNSTEQSVTVAINETVLGNVIKKTMTPYTANTNASKVYLNNQCGANVDILSEISKNLPYVIEKNSSPQILIYHTHTTEAFMDNEEQYYTSFDEPRTTDLNKNIVAVGEKIKQQLESAGFCVIHDTTIHDHPGFSGSYSRSEETVKAILDKYPSIKITIDVHRDSIASGKTDKVAPVVNVDGKDAAQVMLVMGSETGGVENYPNWRTNLRLAMKLQEQFETDYPQFARSILLRSAKYNQNLTNGSILIEIGSDANTFDQALYSGELVGKTLVKLIEKEGS